MKKVRVNREIKAKTIRLIDPDGNQLGIVPLEEGLEKAEDFGLDLVEVAPQADPPVCRIMDYGKYKYIQQKKSQEAKKKQTFIQVKEIKFRPKTEDHDLEYKIKNIRKFLTHKNKVKVTLMFRGREIIYSHLGGDMLNKVAEAVSDIGQVEQAPKMEGRQMTMILAPK